MAARSDAHRPAAIDPADYGFVGSFVNRPPTDAAGVEIDVENPLWPVPGFEPLTFAEALSGKRSPDRAYPGELDRCDHCGQRINYAAVYRHAPTGQFVVMGHRCADAVMGFEDRRALRAREQRDLAAAARKDAAEEAERLGRLAEVRSLYPEAYEILDGYDGPNRFIADVAGRLAETGSLTEGQAEGVVEARARDLERERRRREGDELPVPEGRGQRVEGLVVKAVAQPDNYGSSRWGRAYQVAITVRDDRGFLVWGRAPASLHDLEAPGEAGRRDVGRGDRVRLVANLEAKKKDPYFGFFRRPRKAEVAAFAPPEAEGEAGPEAAGSGRRVFLGDVVEEVREEVRGAGGTPDALNDRQAVAILDHVVEDAEPAREGRGRVALWWRQTEGRDLSRFREAWDERRRENAIGAYRQIRALVDADQVSCTETAERLRDQLGPIADLYVELGGEPAEVGR